MKISKAPPCSHPPSNKMPPSKAKPNLPTSLQIALRANRAKEPDLPNKPCLKRSSAEVSAEKEVKEKAKLAKDATRAAALQAVVELEDNMQADDDNIDQIQKKVSRHPPRLKTSSAAVDCKLSSQCLFLCFKLTSIDKQQTMKSTKLPPIQKPALMAKAKCLLRPSSTMRKKLKETS